MNTCKELKQFILLDAIQIIVALITFFVNFILSYFSRGTFNEYLFVGVAIISFGFVIFGMFDILDQKKIYKNISK